MTQGYFIVSRSLFGTGFWPKNEPLSKEGALIELMSMASYPDRRLVINGNELVIPKGSVALSQAELAKKWRWTRKAVHGLLKRLEKFGHIRMENHILMTVISFTDLLNFSGSKAGKANLITSGRARVELGSGSGRARVDSDQEIQYVTLPPGTSSGQPRVELGSARYTKVLINNKLITKKREEEGTGEEPKNSSLPLVEHPPLSFSDDDFPDFEEIAPKTEVIDDFPDSEPVKTPPPPSTEKPVEWPDNPTEGALFKKEELPAPPKKAKKTPDKPQEPKLEVKPNVWLTKEESMRFRADFPDENVRRYYAAMLSDYKQDNPNWAKKRTSDNRTLRNWIRRDQVEGRGPYKPKPSWTQEKKQEEPQRPRYKTAEETRQMLLKQLGETEGH